MKRWWHIWLGMPDYYGVILVVLGLIVIFLYYRPYITNESEIGLELSQIASAISEKALYSGAEVSIPFGCSCQSVDRWMVSITITANPHNDGYMTMEIEGARKKTFRTGVFRKIAGTYIIPLYQKSDSLCLKGRILRLKLSGGDPNEPLIFIAEMFKNKSLVYQVEIRPEKGYPITMPKNAVFPRSVMEYKKAGCCRSN